MDIHYQIIFILLPHTSINHVYPYSWGIHAVTSIDGHLDTLFPADLADIEQLDPQEVTMMKERVSVWLAALNKQLKDRPFICGDK